MIAVPHAITPADYLSLEHQNPIRHEYRRGLVYAMTGGSDRHARIGFNLLRAIDDHLGDSPCRFYGGDVKVNYQADFYYYPDAFVTCDPRDRQDPYVKRHPKLIVEVLSPATATFDQGDKFADYAQLDSLEEYVLIAQERPWVECRRRVRSAAGAATWATVVYEDGDRVTLASLGLTVAIAQLYRGTD